MRELNYIRVCHYIRYKITGSGLYTFKYFCKKYIDDKYIFSYLPDVGIKLISVRYTIK